MRNILLILGAILVTLILAITFFKKQSQSEFPTLTIENNQGVKTSIRVSIAATPASREQGYSNHPPIEYSEGLLFVFDRPNKYPFWMKEMLFDLDFIMIRNGKIVEIVENVKAPLKDAEEIEIVNPTQSFDQLLEVKAGFVKKFGISLADSISSTQK